jgi:VanZ family protein
VDPVVKVNQSDKVLHCLAFIALTVWFIGVCRDELVLPIALVLAVYGLAIEVLQSFTPNRSADPWDFIADVVGILLGWLLARYGLRRWCSGLEQWLVPAKLP